MTDEKNRELSEEELEKAAGGGDPYRTPSGQGMAKGSGSQGLAAGQGDDLGDAASGSFGTPAPDVQDARGGKSKK
jgi:hypothetical protein